MGGDAEKLEERHAEWRSAILWAAGREFAAHGFRGAALWRIAKRLRADQSLIFFYLPGGKRRLYRRVMERFLESMAEVFRAVPLEGGSAQEELAAAVHRLHDYLARNPDHARLVMRDLQDGGPMLRAIGGETVDAVLEGGVARFREFQERGEIARADPRRQLLTFAGLCLPYYAFAPILSDILGEDLLSAPHTERQKKEATRFLTRGILPPPGAPKLSRRERAERLRRAEALFAEGAPRRPEFLHLDRLSAEWERFAGGLRGRLLESAEQEFAAYGYEGASLRRIARRVGVDKANVYALFGGKRGLYEAVTHGRRGLAARYLVIEAQTGDSLEDWKKDPVDIHSMGDAALLDMAFGDPGPMAVLLRDGLDRAPVAVELFGPMLKWIFESDARGLLAQQILGATQTFDPLHFRLCCNMIVCFYCASADFFSERWKVDLRSREEHQAFRETYLGILFHGIAGRGP